MLSYEEILILLQIGSQGCDSWIKTGYLLVVVTDSEVRGWSVFQLYVWRLYISLIACIIIKGENSEKINFRRISNKKVMLFIDLYIDRYVDKMLRSSWKLAKHTIHQPINKSKINQFPRWKSPLKRITLANIWKCSKKHLCRISEAISWNRSRSL